MPADPLSFLVGFNPQDGISFIFRGLFFILAILYFLFTLIVLRQIFLMTETLITEVAPALKLFGVIYCSIALAVVIIFFIKLFG